MIKKIILISVLNIFICFSQNCEPTSISKDGNIEYFGGFIKKSLSIIGNDTTNYMFLIAQVNKGKGGTIATVSFSHLMLQLKIT